MSSEISTNGKAGRIVAFTGKARSGKTTAAGILEAKGWQRVSFAAPIKEAAESVTLQNEYVLFARGKLDREQFSRFMDGLSTRLAYEIFEFFFEDDDLVNINWMNQCFALIQAIAHYFQVQDPVMPQPDTEAGRKEQLRPVLIAIGKQVRSAAKATSDRTTLAAEPVIEDPILKKMRQKIDQGGDFVIDDLRFRVELEMLKEFAIDLSVFRIRRDGELQIDDPSEKDLDQVEILEIFNNGSLQQLEQFILFSI